MPPTLYRATIAKLGLTQEGAGLWLGVSKRTGQNYAKHGPPQAVAMLLRVMLKFKLKPEDVRP